MAFKSVILVVAIIIGLQCNLVQPQFLNIFSGDDGSNNFTSPISFTTQDFLVIIDETQHFDVVVNATLNQAYELSFVEQHQGLVTIVPKKIDILETNNSYKVSVIGKHPGSLLITGELSPNDTIGNDNLFIRVQVAESRELIYFSEVIGWIYFVAWSVSFYPQLWINYKRKSVTGLSFDFLALNYMGHTLYAIFNSGFYWVEYIQDEYFERHPRGLNPVLLNDVFFSIHASIITLLTIVQCFFYERGGQRVSYTAQGLLATFTVIIVTTLVMSFTHTLAWIDFLYTLSYIKLAITLFKYVPQAVLNYRRKSTSGWSIGNILLDFTGGMLSMLQMIINAYNYDDWISIFGDPTKFGLGLFSVAFDILFIIQHYVLYRDREYEPIIGADTAADTLDEPTTFGDVYQGESSPPEDTTESPSTLNLTDVL